MITFENMHPNCHLCLQRTELSEFGWLCTHCGKNIPFGGDSWPINDQPTD